MVVIMPITQRLKLAAVYRGTYSVS